MSKRLFDRTSSAFLAQRQSLLVEITDCKRLNIFGQWTGVRVDNSDARPLKHSFRLSGNVELTKVPVDVGHGTEFNHKFLANNDTLDVAKLGA